MRFELKDVLKLVAFVAAIISYHLTVSKDLEIRIVKLEAANVSNKEILDEIRKDVKILINKRVR